jgi:DNA polymerase-3 subunit delta'
MSLKNVIGQERAIGILVRTLESDRVPSAYLFAGDAGIGKKFAALNLAKTLNCLSPVTRYALRATNTGKLGKLELHSQDPEPRALNSEPVDACDECPSCKKIDAMTHPDLVLIAPEKGEIRVNEIRAVEEALSFKPFEGKRKIVIIDDADAMNPSAANAFLKTLEEPPDESLMILISAHPDRLPETIRSRCCRLNFVPLSRDACGEVIRRVLSRNKKEGEDTEGVLSLLVRLSMGRPGIALSSDMEKERERFIGLFRSMLHGEGDTWADREEMEKWLDMAFVLLRDMTVLKITEGTCGEARPEGRASCDALLFNSDIKELVSEMTKTADIKGIMRIYNKISLLRGQMGFNLNKAITWNYTASVVRGVLGGR